MVFPYDCDIGNWCETSSSENQKERERHILEQLLTFIGAKTSKQVAGQLLKEYGSFNALLSASVGMGNKKPIFHFLSLMQEAQIELLRSKVLDRINLTSAADVIEYLVIRMSHLAIEEVRVLFLDSKNRLIRDEITGRGSVSEAPFYTREILKRALVLNSTALILAHNHPSGDPEPSEADIEETHHLKALGTEMGILVHDHIVVGRYGWVSLRDRGHI